LVAVVHGLQRRSRAYMDDPTDGNEVALRWLSEMHRESTGEHDKRFLLLGVHMTSPARTRLVAPHVGTSVLEPDHLLQLGNVPSRFTCFVRTGCPLKLTWENDGERHMSTIPAAADSRA